MVPRFCLLPAGGSSWRTTFARIVRWNRVSPCCAGNPAFCSSADASSKVLPTTLGRIPSSGTTSAGNAKKKSDVGDQDPPTAAIRYGNARRGSALQFTRHPSQSGGERTVVSVALRHTSASRRREALSIEPSGGPSRSAGSRTGTIACHRSPPARASRCCR